MLKDNFNFQEWLAPAKPLLMIRFCGTTPNSTALVCISFFCFAAGKEEN